MAASLRDHLVLVVSTLAVRFHEREVQNALRIAELEGELQALRAKAVRAPQPELAALPVVVTSAPAPAAREGRLAEELAQARKLLAAWAETDRAEQAKIAKLEADLAAARRELSDLRTTPRAAPSVLQGARNTAERPERTKTATDTASTSFAPPVERTAEVLAKCEEEQASAPVRGYGEFESARDRLAALRSVPGAAPVSPDTSREASRHVRLRLVRSQTESIRRLPKRELDLGRALYPEEITDRPRTRADCAGGARPCPYVSCRHHLYLDVTPKTGAIKLNFPDLEVDQLPETCALDVADRGVTQLEVVGGLMNVTRERIRQLEAHALELLLMRNRAVLEELWDDGNVGSGGDSPLALAMEDG